MIKDNKDFVKTAKESINKDKENSPYYMTGKTLDTMNNKDIAKKVGKTLDEQSIKKIANFSRFHDNTSNSPMGKDLQTARRFNANKDNRGVHIDEAKINSTIDSKERGEIIKAALAERNERNNIAVKDGDK